MSMCYRPIILLKRTQRFSKVGERERERERASEKAIVLFLMGFLEKSCIKKSGATIFQNPTIFCVIILKEFPLLIVHAKSWAVMEWFFLFAPKQMVSELTGRALKQRCRNSLNEGPTRHSYLSPDDDTSHIGRH